MYSFFLDGWQFPVAPPKMDVKIKGQNKTLTLINDGEVNFLKTPGLTEISGLELLLPMLAAYPFAVYPDGFHGPEYYLAKLEAMMVGKKPAQFIVSRVSPGGKLLFATNMKVSLEEYTIKESASDGLDIAVSLKLKQYRDFGTKTVRVESTKSASVSSSGGRKAVSAGDIVNFTGNRHYVSSTGDKGYACTPGKAKATLVSSGAKHPYHLIGGAYTGVEGNSTVYGWVNASDIDGAVVSSTQKTTTTIARSAETAPSAKSYTVKEGDDLYTVAKKFTGNGGNYGELYKANSSSMWSTKLTVGQVLTLPW